MRVLPSITRPLDLDPSEVERIAAYLSAHLSGWGVPDRLRQSFTIAVSHRLDEALQDMEETRALDLTAYLSSALHDGTLPRGLDLDDTDPDQDQDDGELPYLPRVLVPDPLHVATASSWHRHQHLALGRAIRERRVLVFPSPRRKGKKGSRQ